jgi:ABC-2 type transport system ATP-binding protein
MKLIMQESIEINDLYKLAQKHGVQIRRLNYKRDSLEDIFLKAMENGNEAVSRSDNNGGL